VGTYLSYYVNNTGTNPEKKSLIKKDFMTYNAFVGLNAWGDPTSSTYVADNSSNPSFNSFISSWNSWISAGNGSDKKLALDGMVRALNTKVNSDEVAAGIEKTTLVYTLDGSLALSTGPYETDMVKSISDYQFSDGTLNGDSPISFKVSTTANNTEWKQTIRKAHSTSASQQGWSADYQDPVNTVANFLKGGSYDSNGFNYGNLFSHSSTITNPTLSSSVALLKQNSDLSASLLSSSMQFADHNPRYSSFASLETDLIYKWNLFVPTTYKAYPKTPSLTYINQESLLDGQASYSFFIMKQSANLRPYEENMKQECFRKFECSKEPIDQTHFDAFVSNSANYPSALPKPTWEEFSSAYIINGIDLMDENWKL